MHKRAVFCVVLYFAFNLGVVYGKQSYLNTNTDFLLHEGGGYPNNVKKNNIASQPTNSASAALSTNKQDYNSQFPQLGSSPYTPTTARPTSSLSTSFVTPRPTQPSSGKRDYVAPQFPTLRPPQDKNNAGPSSQQQTTPRPSTVPTPSPNIRSTQSNGKRDYVAPQFPTLRPPQDKNHVGTSSQQTTPNPTIRSTQSNGKRDYVSPQFPTLRPANSDSSTGKVKDLINFYDNKGKTENGPQRVPSYSSILQGSSNKNVPGSPTIVPGFSVTTHTTPKSPGLPTKPMSFSSVVSGSTHSSSPFPSTINTKPTTKLPFSVPTTRPGQILPSSILNNNKNNQGSNSNSVTDIELQSISEELLRKDGNNAMKYITINYQEKTTSQSKEDKAPLPLLNVQPEVWNITTIQKFVPLLDNYERDTLVNEHVTPQERNEENAFMDVIMTTSVIRHLMNFLREKGYVTPDPKQQRDFLKQLWFGLYSRGKGKISSSGFEHIFVSELKNGGVSGLHNWIYFSKEEVANRINYLGYLKYAQLNDRGVVMKFHFNQQGIDKPVDSMFIGTSPELEMALYTLCFVIRADNECKLKLGTKDVDIVTHTFRYRSKNFIGSAYPEI